jgi:hypothetical protein
LTVMPKFIFDDNHYADITDLLLQIRDARLAWQAARAGVAEWEGLSDEILRAWRAAAPLHVLIDETKSWSVGWWRRADMLARKARETAKTPGAPKTRETLSALLYDSK